MSNKSHNPSPVLVLPNIRSVYNVGSIFRTADAAGIKKIYLVGVTPGPHDRFGRERTDIAKVALGAEKTVVWEHVPTLTAVVQDLRAQGYYIVALEQDVKSVDYKTVTLPQSASNFAFIVGEETQGLSKDELELADIIVEIPMHGGKESLNVSVATGVAIFRILDK
ncbi:MAG: TrmH family RNA methyltransferase [Candidatus Pacebacteria bacterium]|nr:TrmH family RNA methyltransferase [Candidatus Paceibacterota bacterium]